MPLAGFASIRRQFRATYGETPYAYLMTRRIERAKALLRRGDLSVTEVCMAVGVRRSARSAHASSASKSANDVAREDFHWITVGATSQPGVGIVLTNYLNGSPADGDAPAALVAKGAPNGVHFRTNDLDATFEQVRASGAEIVQEPTEQPWGMRDFAVPDPSGNLVRIDQPPAA